MNHPTHHLTPGFSRHGIGIESLAIGAWRSSRAGSHQEAFLSSLALNAYVPVPGLFGKVVPCACSTSNLVGWTILTIFGRHGTFSPRFRTLAPVIRLRSPIHVAFGVDRCGGLGHRRPRQRGDP